MYAIATRKPCDVAKGNTARCWG